MADVTITDTELVVTIKGIRKLGAVRNELTIPLKNVRGATVDPGLSTGWPGINSLCEWPGTKIVGTDAYGRYLGGTFSQNGERVFWDVANPEKAIVVSLGNERFKRLYIEVDDPDRVVSTIEAAITKR
ncbi:hypothetical protein SAMN04487905_1035 [Actinopolyspora xinjiangensis]|uniref:Uncharacterized protein n=1 Tax=Actinopolyspora xinjiangensis TaxID=405564 RepID=A0A1H0RCA1_9ACTN|nr:hypothetical protein [Actinopolyspora xinjiangensis]SDP27173.1 hypothetical protein SAMN04487905_1035 [Actinopolyspora xinjiangensis]